MHKDELEKRLRAYFKSFFSLTPTRGPIIDRLELPDIEYSLNELFIIAVIILLHDYEEDHRKQVYDITHDSKCLISLDSEQPSLHSELRGERRERNCYRVSLTVDSRDFESKLLIEIANTLRGYVSSKQTGRLAFDSFIIMRFETRMDSHSSSKCTTRAFELYDVCSIMKLRNLLFHLLEV